MVRSRKVAPTSETLGVVVVLPRMHSPRCLCATSRDACACISSNCDFDKDEFANRNSTRRRFHKPGSVIIAGRFEGVRRYISEATEIPRYHLLYEHSEQSCSIACVRGTEMTRLPSRVPTTCLRPISGRSMLGHRLAMSPNFRRDRLARFQLWKEPSW